MRFLGFAVLVTAAFHAAAHSVSLNGDWMLRHRQSGSGAEWESLSATVPGNAELDLFAAGVIPDPMIGTNVWGLFEYETHEWIWSRRFRTPDGAAGRKVRLRFEGIDTRAEISLNGKALGRVQDMFVPHEFDVGGILRRDDENELSVHVFPAIGVDEDQMYARLGNPPIERARVRKASHMYGWDIMPRLVSAGIWRGVYLDVLPQERVADAYWRVVNVDPAKQTAEVAVAAVFDVPFPRFGHGKVRASLRFRGKTVAADEMSLRTVKSSFKLLKVKTAQLWWPRGSGAQPLYDAIVEIIDETGKTLARDERKIGLRTIRLEREDWKSEKEPGKFQFHVNGEPIFIKGTNWTPLDALHSRDASHYASVLPMVTNLNCNMVRVWGGGVYEDSPFWDFCDANGILVWQDMAMACILHDQDRVHADEYENEARKVVLRLRSRTSLALWCSDNESDICGGWYTVGMRRDPNRERVSREILPRILFDMDESRPYLPSSPYVSPEVFAGRAKCSEDHLWGARGYYKTPFYTNSTAAFVSEIGYHGCPNRESLEKMMTKGNVYPWKDAEQLVWNDEWQCKATMAWPDRDSCADRNNLMTKQVKILFGEVSRDLDTFIDQSQSVQAEAMKYFMELWRVRKGHTGGMVWWNLRDGWPILSDGVVDWYNGKKRAYHALKMVQGNVLVTIADSGEVIAVNDRLYPVNGAVTVKDAATGATLFKSDTTTLPKNSVRALGRVKRPAKQGMFRIEYDFDATPMVNAVLYGDPPFDFRKYRKWRERANAPLPLKPDNHANCKWTEIRAFDFGKGGLDRSVWRQFENHRIGWGHVIVTNDAVASVKDGALRLAGEVNACTNSIWERPFRCGRVKTQDALTWLYGKVEIEAKFEDQAGSLAAFWMVPQDGQWPYDGEIDIVERLNADRNVYQTVHSVRIDRTGLKTPRDQAAPAVDTLGWNVYGLEWFPDEMVWTVNGRPTHRYPKISDSRDDWPWDIPNYLRLEMIMENRGWAGEVATNTLPCAVHVKSVRFFKGEMNGREFGKVLPARPLDNAFLRGDTVEKKCFYAPGEQMTFVMEMQGDEAMRDGDWFVKWKRTGDDGREMSGSVPLPLAAPVVVTTRLDRAGFVRVRADVVDASGNAYRKKGKRGDAGLVFFDGGAGVLADTLKSVQEPDDFDAYWAGERANLLAVPLDVKRTELKSPDEGVKLYSVEIDCPGTRPATGYLTVPIGKTPEVKFPAKVHAQGYGAGTHSPPIGKQSRTCIHFRLNAHGYELGREDGYYRNFMESIKSNGHKYAFDPEQNADRDKAYFHGMVLRMMQALRYMKTLPEWDGKNLGTEGGSQGGMQSVWGAALDTDVTFCEPSVPWCCDIGGTELGRNRGDWYVKWTPALGYYDAVNFAKRIRPTCQVMIWRAGLGDYICPPSGIAALWNALDCPKAIRWEQGGTHGWSPPSPNRVEVWHSGGKVTCW